MTAGIDPQHVVIIEPVRGSDIPVQLMYVEMIDGLYAPIGLRTPPGTGPFPLVLFASGNGGGGMAVVRDFTQNVSWTQEQFLKAGYAVAWLRYRAEVDYAYDKIGKLIEDKRQRRQLFNRGPLEYEDVISIVEYRQNIALDSGGPNRLHGHEPWRRDGVQDRVGISRRARHDRQPSPRRTNFCGLSPTKPRTSIRRRDCSTSKAC